MHLNNVYVPSMKNYAGTYLEWIQACSGSLASELVDGYAQPFFKFLLLELPQKGNNCASPCEMAEIVISYLEEKGYLQA
ncbi:hypothetical protein Golax_005240 [Gossypium laxum]|uniref:Uncharacterized protein n=3 Tax=Gossypium TaxID=3633 RepID=A0A7J8XMB7_GOSAI|nr:hypothetical protein [Gossypium lobatum]MBA0688461.1 hypothetical protein [Gossypium aridum]MBA0717414.1 hypothetical protein [Gossypium laxum]